MKKENFITMLKNISSEDIVRFIKENGKEPKLIRPVIFVKRS